MALAGAAPAEELGSSSYRQLGGHLNAASGHALQSASFDGGGSLGQSAAVGFSAAAAALDTHAAGFWPIAEGALPSLDADGDGLDDGQEVAGGSDPNDPSSPGPPTKVPSGTPVSGAALALLLGAAVIWRGLALRRG